MVDLVERIRVLLEQESKHYCCEDYLAPLFQQKLLSDHSSPSCVQSISSCASSNASTSSSNSGINELWREKICEWSYQVVDHFDFSREVVNISISFLDRYLATRPVDKKLFQLAAMTTLYLAIKLYEPGTLSMTSMIDLSRGYFMVEQMAAMETAILRALDWHVHPPTPFCLARHIQHLLPQNACSPTVRHDVLELARFLTELSVCDYFFVTRKASSNALAALLNAMDALQAGISFPARLEFLQNLKMHLDLDASSKEVQECRVRLHELYTQGGYAAPKEEVHDRETVSPVCVGAVNLQA
mmetsp:Transcript_10482/g.14864  ORF Transcript_10482/g.14864 Transcript_10482/m.14864 type:complete len:300 (+) Transcript_10482:126-1025(+)